MIPSMGGAEIADRLERYARDVPKDTAIVEFGAWLGAGTVPLARGAKASGAVVHCYDRWMANAEQVEIAERFGVRLKEGESILPHFVENVSRVEADVRPHPGDLSFISWQYGPIGLYVDDASKSRWARAWGVFGKAFVAGVTRLVMMDFTFPSAKPQREFMADNARMFSLEEMIQGTSVAVFRYRGRAA